MLQVTREAAALIIELVEQARAPEAGLRIAQRDDHVALAMSIAEEPGPDDTVLIESEVRVFLGPVAQQRLAGQILDARSGETGSAFFVR